MMKEPKDMSLTELIDRLNDVDLKRNVVPISKAASSLAALLKRSHQEHEPIIVTQKGYPTGVILEVDLFEAVRHMLEQVLAGPRPAEDEPVDMLTK